MVIHQERERSVYNKGGNNNKEGATIGLRMHVAEGGQKEAWID